MPARSAPASPPKRMTRARAAAKTTAEPSEQSKPKTATSRSTRAKQVEPVEQPSLEDEETIEAAPAKRATRQTATKTLDTAPRRRVKVTPLTEPVVEPAPVEVAPKPDATTRSRSSRSRKAIDETAEKQEEPVEEVKTRATRSSATPAAIEMPPPKTRGRTRKTTVVEEPAVEEKPARRTRTRAASDASVVTEQEQPKAPTTRKKVTFQDVAENDKENLPAAKTKTGAKSAGKQDTTTSKAKPARKAAPTTTTTATATRTRATRSAVATKEIPKPLSPKKPTQVAKAIPTDSEEDELSGAKTPIRPLLKSPFKQLDAVQLSSIKKLDFEKPTALPQSPAKTTMASVLLSPARRPPASPLKDILKESPKRGGELSAAISTSPSKHTDLRPKSPEANKSFLMQSPRRVQLDVTAFRVSGMTPGSAMKASLLQSPPKRLFSPAKSTGFAPSPAKSFLQRTPAKPVLMTETATSCNFRASRSPERVVLFEDIKTNQPEETPAKVLDFDESVLDIRSPIKVPTELETVDEGTTSFVEDPFTAPVSLNTPLAMEEDVNISQEAVEELPATEDAAVEDLEMDVNEQPSVPTSTFQQPSFKTARELVDESSEDELQADETPIRRFQPPSKTPMNHNVGRSRLSTINPADTTREIAFTPLAAQLTKWQEKTPVRADAGEQKRGIFSVARPRQQDLAVIPVEDAQASLPSTSKKARASIGARRSIASRTSISSSMAGSPTKLSFFDDEMAVRELEEELESAHESEAQSPETANEVSDDGFDEIMDDVGDDTIVADKEEGVSMLNLDQDMEQEIEQELRDMEQELQVTEESEVTLRENAITELAQVSEDEDEEMTTEESTMEEEVDEVDELHAEFHGNAEVAEELLEEDSLEETTVMAPEVQDDETVDAIEQQVAEAPVEEELVEEASVEISELPEVAVVDIEQESAAEPAEESALEESVEESTLEESVEDSALEESVDELSLPTAEAHEESPSIVNIADEPSTISEVHEAEPSLDEIVGEPSATSPEAQMEPSEVVEEESMVVAQAQLAESSVEQTEEMPTSPMSQESVYGDENSLVADAEQAELATAPADADIATSRTPLKEMATPARPNLAMPRYLNTVVSKVPLRPEGNGPTLTIPRKRTRSLSASSSSPRKFAPLAVFELPKSKTYGSLSPERRTVSTPAKLTENAIAMEAEPDDKENIDDIEAPGAFERFLASSPTRSPRRPLGEVGVLKGAVVFVDVHTTEGEDASGIFIELLTEMGAKCVKTWSWNPRASINPAGDEENATAARKIGITHVVYKDGGKRTLEKVRDAGGVVHCVGVSWVLDCERQNKWVDESQYAVDISIFPRGGSRRRKSMEPKALMNLNGNLKEARRSFSADMTPAKRQAFVGTSEKTPQQQPAKASVDVDDDEDMDFSSPCSAFSTPTAVQNVFTTGTESPSAQEFPATPTGFVDYDPSAASPMTPYYLSQGAKLVQQTCPPKQNQQGLFFPLSGEISDQTDERLRARLERARRKTANWRPKISSPLGP